MLLCECVFILLFCFHLDKGDFAGADVICKILDGDLSVMLQVALLTKDVMDAGHYFVPLVVVTVPAKNINWRICLENKNSLKNDLALLLLKRFPQLFYFSLNLGNYRESEQERLALVAL